MRSLVSASMFGKVRKDKSSYVFQGNSKNSRTGCLHRRYKDSPSNVATASSLITAQSKTKNLKLCYQCWLLPTDRVTSVNFESSQQLCRL